MATPTTASLAPKPAKVLGYSNSPGPIDMSSPQFANQARPTVGPPMAVAGVDTNHDGRPNYLYAGVDRNLDGIPDALETSVKARVPVAVVGVDTNHDGRPNYLYAGVDRNLDGMPDALQTSTRSGLAMTSMTFAPMAGAGVDTNHDGRANYLYVGADRNLDGVPDALQAKPMLSPVVATMSGEIPQNFAVPTYSFNQSALGAPQYFPAPSSTYPFQYQPANTTQTPHQFTLAPEVVAQLLADKHDEPLPAPTVVKQSPKKAGCCASSSGTKDATDKAPKKVKKSCC